MAGELAQRHLPTLTPGEVEIPHAIKTTSELMEHRTWWAEHSHATDELLWNERGVSTAVIDSQVWLITPYAGLWIPAGVPHQGTTPSGTLLRAAQFQPVQPGVPADGGHPNHRRDQVRAISITPLLHHLLVFLEGEDVPARQREAAELLAIVMLDADIPDLSLRIPRSEVLAPIMAQVRQNLIAVPTLEQWAQRLDLSARTITRQFVRETGRNYRQWVQAVRVQVAAVALGEGKAIVEVAETTGYSSPSAFTAAFRRATGSTPARFRSEAGRWDGLSDSL